MTVGQSIRKLRLDRGYTLEALTVVSGISLATLSHWERDETTPTVTLLCCLADVFEVSLDELVGRTTKKCYEWLNDSEGKPYCSKCRARPLFMRVSNTAQRVRTPYCPRCGAEMKVGD